VGKRLKVLTLGCKANFADSASVVRLAAAEGFEVVSPASSADVVIINSCTVTHRAGEKVATFGRGRAEAEEPPGSARPRIDEIGPEREVSANETVLVIRVGGRQGQAVCVHQVHDIGTGLTRDFAEQTVGVYQGRCVARCRQCGAQGRQVAEDLRQGFVTVQGAEQVGDVQVQGLAVLIGQHVAVITFGQMLQRPQQRRQAECQKGKAAPARAGRQSGSHGH